MAELTRRDVNLSLLAAAFGLGGGPGRQTVAPRLLMRFAIAGGFYHGLAAALPHIRVGTPLDLRPEPENPHDRAAVAVLLGGAKLGYVPRVASGIVARMIGEGWRTRAEVDGVLDYAFAHEIPDDLLFTGFSSGDPLIRLSVEQQEA